MKNFSLALLLFLAFVPSVLGQGQSFGGGATFANAAASAQLGATSDIQISNAISSLTGGNGTVWADYSTNQTWAACPTWGSGNVDLLLQRVPSQQ
jgi:hypothetical protein